MYVLSKTFLGGLTLCAGESLTGSNDDWVFEARTSKLGRGSEWVGPPAHTSSSPLRLSKHRTQRHPERTTPPNGRDGRATSSWKAGPRPLQLRGWQLRLLGSRQVPGISEWAHAYERLVAGARRQVQLRPVGVTASSSQAGLCSTVIGLAHRRQVGSPRREFVPVGNRSRAATGTSPVVGPGLGQHPLLRPVRLRVVVASRRLGGQALRRSAPDNS